MSRKAVEVTLEGAGVSGRYIVVDGDGDRLVLEKALRPTPAELHERHGTRPLSEAEFAEHFGDLPHDPGE